MDKSKKILLTLVLSMFLGSVFGSLTGNFINPERFQKLDVMISSYINTINQDYMNINKSDYFNAEIIKYSKMSITLFILSFVSVSVPAISFVLFSKGLSYGFTASIILRKYGLKGIIYILGLFFPQSIILIPMYILISFLSIKYIMYSKNKLRNNLKIYAVTAIFISFCITLVSLMDIYITPMIIKSL